MNMFKPPDDIVNYWNGRYETGGNSGAGSYGVESEVKASFINNLIDNTKKFNKQFVLYKKNEIF